MFVPEFKLIPVDEPDDECSEFELLIILLFALFELDDEPLELEFDDDDTACPVTKPCNISAKFFALAYFKRKTFNPPRRSADGVSKVSIIWRMRFRVCVSPLIIIRLVRLSAIIRTRAPFKSFADPVEVIDSNKPIISVA